MMRMIRMTTGQGLLSVNLAQHDGLLLGGLVAGKQLGFGLLFLFVFFYFI